jgi:hypothetical protein
MRVSTSVLRDKSQTASEMYNLVESYHNDLKNITVIYGGKKRAFSDLQLLEAFDVIKTIPYQQDSQPIEILSRPQYIGMQGTGADCKKKSILMGSWLKENGIPYRFVAMSTAPDRRVHHVFTQGFFNKQWKNLDPTYSDAIPFQPKTVTAYEVL